ncbi:hypothetical protein KC339_g26 [Hortaea werneckii]|nr:hypothetical protein KC339_g26 [Hortaea werneckii]
MTGEGYRCSLPCLPGMVSEVRWELRTRSLAVGVRTVPLLLVSGKPDLEPVGVTLPIGGTYPPDSLLKVGNEAGGLPDDGRYPDGTGPENMVLLSPEIPIVLLSPDVPYETGPVPRGAVPGRVEE